MTGSSESGVRGVLHVVLSLNPGGTERLVIEIVRRTAGQFPTAVCCLDEPGAWAAELDALSIPVASLGRRPGFHPSLGKRVAEVVRRHGATVLHCHQYSPFVYGRLAMLWQRGLRLVYTEHGRLSDAPPSRKRRAANLVLGRFSGQAFAVSAELRTYMLAEGFGANRVGVLYNGIEPRSVPSGEQGARARHVLCLPTDALVVGTVARLDPVKDLGTLVRGFAAARSVTPGMVLVIIGDGRERAALEGLVRELGLEGSVRFAGERYDVRDLLGALDVYANSSISEGISVTILEAMAAGLPVVATRVGGTPEVVVDGETGLLVEARSPEAFARALMVAGSRETDRRAWGAAGRRRLEARFTLDRMVSEYIDAYCGRGPRG